MSDEFFRKTFGDTEPVEIGSGWISGVIAVFLGLLGVGAVLCLRFPQLLTLPEARAHYPMGVIRPLIQGVIAAAFVFAGISAVLRERKVLALTGAGLALVATALGGGSVPLPDEVGTTTGIGLDWFVLDLFVMTLVLFHRHPSALAADQLFDAAARGARRALAGDTGLAGVCEELAVRRAVARSDLGG